MKKSDILIILVALLAASALFYFYNRQNSAENNVLVRIDGNVVEHFSLKDEVDYKAESSYGYNYIHIKAGQVYISDADCKNKICVDSGMIDKTGQSLICLPHRLSVEIIGINNPEIDAISN